MKPERLLAILLSVLFAGTASPGELILESPLDNLSLRQTAITRLDLSSDVYRGEDWTGLRNTLRIQRALGENTAWSMGLPWIYSSAEEAGLGLRGNLVGGFAWSPPWLSFLRLGCEGWLPFSDDRLMPLQVKRGFLRWSLASGLNAGSHRFDVGVSRSSELRGLLGDEEGDPWLAWSEGELRWSFAAWDSWTPQLSARAAFRGGESLWTELGGGFRLRWSEFWSLELSAGAMMSDLDAPFPSARVGIAIRRDFPDPVIEEEVEDPEALSDLARDAAAGGEIPATEEGEDPAQEAPPSEDSDGNGR